MTENLTQTPPQPEDLQVANVDATSEWSPPQFVHVAHTIGIRAVEANIEVEEDYNKQISTERWNIMAMPDQTDGLNLNRIEAYSQDARLSTKPVKYLAPEDYKKAVQRMKAVAQEAEGVYDHNMGISMVQRSPELEALNGSAITESFAVHEKAHSTAPPAPVRVVHTTSGRLFWKKAENEMRSTRSGFSVHGTHKHAGGLMEEGYAEFERGRFVEENDLVDDFTRGASNYERFSQTGIPMKYFYKDKIVDGEPELTMPPGALVATIFEKLGERDPEFVSLLRESRHGVEGHRAFASKIDQLEPGLYSQLMHGDLTTIAGILRELNAVPAH
jgi:hypothetical protein